jgi:hypothetical protein
MVKLPRSATCVIRLGQPCLPARRFLSKQNYTLDDFTTNNTDLADLTHFQQALDRERKMHNEQFPTQASDCQGRPPLIAHPELLKPRRYYQPEIELALFSLQRVYDYLATFTFERKVSVSDQVSLGCRVYSIGIALAQQLTEKVVQTGEWIFFQKPANAGEQAKEFTRRSVKNLDVTILTGLVPQEIHLPKPVQLSFPF